MKLSDKIVQLRKANSWSQEDFAEKMNVSRQAISRWENGTALPDAQNVLQISKLFKVTTDYLLNDDFEDDGDISNVQTAAEKTTNVFSKNKQRHLIAAICFTLGWLVSFIGVATYNNYAQLWISLICLGFSACNAVLQFTYYFKKR